MNQALKLCGTAVFPEPVGSAVNMMPIIMGDADSVPAELHGYLPMIDKSRLRQGSTVYLSVQESVVRKGETQRRPGIHTDGTARLGWGGGSWGSTGSDAGIYLASTDGACRIWDTLDWSGDEHGATDEPIDALSHMAMPNALYWIADRTPHEATPAQETELRQWFRLVSEHVGGWWEQHSTPNPLGVAPNATILLGSKFGS